MPQEHGAAECSSGDATNPECYGLERKINQVSRQGAPCMRRRFTNQDWWATQSRLGVLAHGLADWMGIA